MLKAWRHTGRRQLCPFSPHYPWLFRTIPSCPPQVCRLPPAATSHRAAGGWRPGPCRPALPLGRGRPAAAGMHQGAVHQGAVLPPCVSAGLDLQANCLAGVVCWLAGWRAASCIPSPLPRPPITVQAATELCWLTCACSRLNGDELARAGGLRLLARLLMRCIAGAARASA